VRNTHYLIVVDNDSDHLLHCGDLPLFFVLIIMDNVQNRPGCEVEESEANCD